MTRANPSLECLREYLRIPEGLLVCPAENADELPVAPGFFRFRGQTCYGRSSSGTTLDARRAAEFDVPFDAERAGLPFSFAEVIDNLRFERYRQMVTHKREVFAGKTLFRKLYGAAWPVPLLRRGLQRAYFSDWKTLPFPTWPVDVTVDALHREYLRLLMQISDIQKIPFIWFWPQGASSCLIMTHDVETSVGRDFTPRLMDLDDSFGIKASFQVVPEERYTVSGDYISEIKTRGFEFNVHDLNHDGDLYRDRGQFEGRAKSINAYVRKYNARGFRAGSMYRRQDWYGAFEFAYDMSVPNVAHLEPMRGGCCTVMPYFVGDIVELPLTLAEDYSLFQMLGDYSIDLWKRQLEIIREQNGLMSVLAHPDYLTEKRAQRAYENLLCHVNEIRAKEHVWFARPGEVNDWWRARNEMELVTGPNGWEIVGPSSERARLAYAVSEGDHLAYEIAGAACGSAAVR